MWHHLCNRFNSVTLRVLHPGISPHQTVPILRGLPEGSRLSPTLFGLFAADLVNHLKRMPQSSTRVSTCGSVVFYMSMTYAYSPPAQMNSNACYMTAKRGAKSADADQCPEVQGDGFPRDTSTKAETQGTDKTHDISLPTDLPPILPHCGSLPAVPSHRQCFHLLEEVQEFDYLGLRLDPI